jgi:hypothetical protein
MPSEKQGVGILPSLGGLCMSRSRLLASLLIALSSATVAHAQAGLGAPLASEDSKPRPLPAVVSRTALAPPQPAIEPTIPTRDDVARMIADCTYSPAEIFAAKIKLDESQVTTRVNAIRYLALVDFYYYPEAETGLIAALRMDGSETVRHEAAIALGGSRRATRRVIDALSVAALGHVTDGNPAETSERVRLAARQALTRVLANGAPNEYVPPVASVLPATFTVPASPVAPSATPQERQTAESISATPRSSLSSKSLFPWLHSLTQQRSASTNVDPRLRGLSVLSPDSALAIPRR